MDNLSLSYLDFNVINDKHKVITVYFMSGIIIYINIKLYDKCVI
jgi:hypothetical protein